MYDTDTGLYYLQSRYYDPKTGRFINADDTAYVDTNSGTPLSTNMFAYCENNHINKVDPTGTCLILILGVKYVVSSIVEYVYKHSMAFQFYFFSFKNKVFYLKYNFTKKMYVNKIIRSKAYKKLIKKVNFKNIIENMKKKKRKRIRIPNNYKYFSVNFYDSSPDLYLSIGDCLAYFTIKKTTKRNSKGKTGWKITVEFFDSYNFEYWSTTKKNKLTKFLNNQFGYKLQKYGIITPYSWYIDYSFYKYY